MVLLRLMAVIECPYCDEDIELDDDASGLFDCPHCDGEFEWGTEEEEEEDYTPAMNRISNTPNTILVEYSDNPTLRITAGVIFSIVMGIYAVLSLFMIFGGLFLSSVESDISDATGGAVESGIGIFVILIGFVMLAIYSTGIYFGVQMSKGRFFALIVCSVVSVLSLIMTFIAWASEDGDECNKWETDSFGWEQCVEWGSAPFPVFDVILWTGMTAMLAALIFVPKFRSQFY